MEKTEIFELAFFGTSICGALYGLEGNRKDRHYSNISAVLSIKRLGVGHGFIWRELGTREGLGSIFFIVSFMQEIQYHAITNQKDLLNEFKNENWHLEANAHWLNMHILMHTHM